MAPAAAQTFSSPTVIDNSHNASEPGITTDPSGNIFVNAPIGLPGPSLVWRSGDAGTTWKATGPGTVGASPSPAANVTIGGGDSDLATDASGNLYFVDLWLGNSSTAVSHDSGNSWLGQPLGTMPIQDRPWVSADPRPGQQGIAYSVTEQLGTGLWISRSVASNPLAGAVYPLSTLEIATAQRGVVGTVPPGNLVTGMNGTTYNVYSTFTGTGPGQYGVGISALPPGGLTTTNSSVTPADGAYDTSQNFPVAAVDNTNDNNVYVVWTDPTPSAWNIRFASSTDGGKTWSSAVTVGQGVYPWITADAPGKVDIAWYSAGPSYTGDPNNAPAGTQWNVAFAQSLNATSSPATFTAPETAATNIKTGAICTQGTGCSANRELGDFMSIAHDSAGNALVAFAAMPSSGHSNIEFAKQTAGTGIG
ncbi:MAG TPA: hypothetical protein VMU90_01000 [Solirubrobacteraceae bacterium]|nr:hypothetical protein [Solirubrobacteraceae bacterium]